MADSEEIKLSSEKCSQLQVNFFTKYKVYTVPQTPFSIPVNVTCEDLSSLINSILQQENILHDEKQVDFDFLINGQFITDTLQSQINSQNLSTETVVEIEYVEKQAEPWPEKMMLQDDWVSSIAVSNDCILSGSYDNMVYFWDFNGNCLSSVDEHTAAVKAVEWIMKDNKNCIFVSSSLDQTVKICEFCSGSWDRTLKIWSSDLASTESDHEEDNVLKKAKTELAQKNTITRTPLMTLTGHNEAVSSVLWLDDCEIVSCGWDHTIRVWDAQSGVNQHTLTGGKAFNCISYSPHSRLIASASADRHVRLWDHRIKDGAVFQKTLTSHDGWLSSVDWSPRDQFLLVSGSYDNTVNLWDTRSPKQPLHTLRGHNNQVMCVNWTIEQFVVSGGSDNQLIIHRVSGNDDELNGDSTM